MAVNTINGGNHTRPLVNEGLGGNGPATVTTAGQGTPDLQVTPSGDSVTLTSTAAQLRNLEKQLASVPVVDAQRVNAVRSEIASGTFVIDPPRVASKMIQIEGMIASRAN